MEILYQDPFIVVVDKPSGLLSIQDGFNPEIENAKRNLEHIFGRIWIVHRLDKDTSGVLIFARDSISHKSLSEQFTNRSILKEYIALVIGVISQDETEIDLRLRINGDRSHRTVIDRESGKTASTLIKVIDRRRTTTLVSAFPKTGYTHQIRCHLAAIGYPIAGDKLYSPRGYLTSGIFPRMYLHAYKVTVCHPHSGKTVTFISELPPLFNEIG